MFGKITDQLHSDLTQLIWITATATGSAKKQAMPVGVFSCVHYVAFKASPPARRVGGTVVGLTGRINGDPGRCSGMETGLTCGCK